MLYKMIEFSSITCFISLSLLQHIEKSKIVDNIPLTVDIINA